MPGAEDGHPRGAPSLSAAQGSRPPRRRLGPLTLRLSNERMQALISLWSILPEALLECMLVPLYPFIARHILQLRSDGGGGSGGGNADRADPGGVAGVDDQIGYYAGLLGSCFYAPLFVMNIAWGLASDRVGRKPVLLLGVLVGGCASLMLSLSSHFWVPFAARLLAGLFGANSTVTKGHLGALMPDEVERSWAYGIYGSVYGIMGIVGPLLGSLLTDPARRYPGAVAADGFLAHHPFFLPIITTTALHVAGFVLITRRFEGPKLASAFRALAGRERPSAAMPTVHRRVSASSLDLISPGISHGDVLAPMASAVLGGVIADMSRPATPVRSGSYDGIFPGSGLGGGLGSGGGLSGADADDGDPGDLSRPASDAGGDAGGLPRSARSDSVVSLSSDVHVGLSGPPQRRSASLARPPPTSPQATLRAIREDHSPAGARASRGGLSWATVRAALTPAVLRAIGLYCSIALVNMLWTIILPLYFSTAAVDGGLGLRASQASLPLAALMAAKFLVQFFGSVHIVAPLGSRATFIVGMLLVGPVLLALGLLHTLPAGAGRWLALLSCMMLLGVAEAMCYLSVILQITMSVPSASQLGLVHGIATSAAAMVRTIAPAAGGAMWQGAVRTRAPFAPFGVMAGIAFTVPLIMLRSRNRGSSHAISGGGAASRRADIPSSGPTPSGAYRRV